MWGRRASSATPPGPGGGALRPLNTPAAGRTLPMADSTTTGKFSWKLQMMSATSCMRSASRTDEPPNLYTTFNCRGRAAEPPIAARAA